MTEPAHPHWPVVTPLREAGQWGVFCAECSRQEADYVNPCRIQPHDQWPPAVLYEVTL